MDETTAEDKVKELRLQLSALRSRVARMEAVLFRAVVAISAGALVLGFLMPFLTTTEKADEYESVSLLPAVLSLDDSGGGPFSEEASMAAVVAAMFALAILVALIALLRLFGYGVGSRTVRVARVCGIVALVACAMGWLLVFTLAGHFEGRVSAFSPATLSFTVGGAVALVAAALHPADWRD